MPGACGLIPIPRPSWPRRYTTTPMPSSAICAQRGLQLSPAVAAHRAEDISGQALAVHPHEHVRLPGRLTHDECQMGLVVDHALVGDAAKLAELGR